MKRLPEAESVTPVINEATVTAADDTGLNSKLEAETDEIQEDDVQENEQNNVGEAD